MRCLVAIFMCLFISVAGAAPLGTGFTYQGELKAQNTLANGIYDFEYSLYDVPTDGTAVAGPLLLEDVSVQGGIFTVELDFGSGVFNGVQLWLGIAVREGTSEGAFSMLNPRQKLTASPYTLARLNCREGQIAKIVNGNWTCAQHNQARVSRCPCNIQTLNSRDVLLSWGTPVCSVRQENTEDVIDFSLTISNSPDRSEPGIEVRMYQETFDFGSGPEFFKFESCGITWPDSQQFGRDKLRKPVFDDCLADIRDFWLSIGDGSSCELEIPDDIWTGD